MPGLFHQPLRRRNFLKTSLLAVTLGTTGCQSRRATFRPIPDRLVVLTFDDSVKSHFTVAAPLLRRYRFGATFFITEGFNFRSNKIDYMTWEEIRSLHDQGFEIGNHTRDHLNLDPGQRIDLGEQIEAINARCLEFGIPRPVSFAYPGNFVTEDLKIPMRLKDFGILWARRGMQPELPGPGSFGVGFAYEPGADHPLLIPSAGVPGPQSTLKEFIQSVSLARSGRIAVIQFHGVPEGEHPWVDVKRETFEQFMKYLHDHRYTVISMRDLARYVDPKSVPEDPLAVVRHRRANSRSITPP